MRKNGAYAPFFFVTPHQSPISFRVLSVVTGAHQLGWAPGRVRPGARFLSSGDRSGMTSPPVGGLLAAEKAAGADLQALPERQPVDKQRPIQVVDLVVQADGI